MSDETTELEALQDEAEESAQEAVAESEHAQESVKPAKATKASKKEEAEAKLTPTERRAAELAKYNAYISDAITNKVFYPHILAFRTVLEDAKLDHLLTGDHERLVAQYLTMPKRA